jgi:hypothetical protein
MGASLLHSLTLFYPIYREKDNLEVLEEWGENRIFG